MIINEEGAPARETPLQDAKGITSSASSGFTGEVQLSRTSLITILICTGLSVLFLRTGILSFFYLAPLGFAVVVTGSIWIPFFSAAGTNIIFDLVSRFSARETVLGAAAVDSSNILVEIFYYSSMFLLFIWIMGAKTPRTTYRLLAGSAAGAIAFLLLVYKTNLFSSLEAFIEKLYQQDVLAGNPAESAGDESINSILQGLPSAERMMELFNSMLLRGAAFFSILFIFFINRHFSFVLVRLIKKRREDKPLTEFFAPQNAIWILAGALASVLIIGLFKIELLEILAWNVFIIYAVIFLAQGVGILSYLLSKRSAGFRIGVSIFLIFILFSPISLAAVVMLLLLGIIENWIPIRAGKGIQPNNLVT